MPYLVISVSPAGAYIVSRAQSKEEAEKVAKTVRRCSPGRRVVVRKARA